MINRSSNYRWYILTLGVATHMLVVALPYFCMPVLFKEISDELGLDLVQIGIVWGMVSLPQLFAAFAAGMISDKFGATRTLGIACILVGIAGAMRGTSGGFTSMAIIMFLFGLVCIPLTFTTHKAAGEWFSGQQLGLANGILAMGMGLGTTTASMFSATVFSPLLGGWRNVMFLYGALAAVIGVLWLMARRRPAEGEVAHSTETVPFRQALSHVTRLRAIWILSLFMLCINAYVCGVVGYLPLYLRDIGWTAVSADGALAALTGASVLGVIPLTILSDRIGLRKIIIYLAIFMIIVGVTLLSLFTGPAVWLAAVMVGIVQEAFFALLITMIMETRGVGATYAGTALGLATTFGGLGGFFSPPIGNRLAEINPRFAFLFWGAMIAVLLFFFRFIEETGWKKKGISSISG